MNNIFFANTSRFPYETIDSETVLIDSEKGYLFLFSGIGSWLWHRMIVGGTIDDLVAESVARYGVASESSIRQFLEELVEAEMIQPGLSAPTAIADSPADWPEVFEPPVIERYNEISDILSMDPIHEVDPAKGWPRQPDGRA